MENLIINNLEAASIIAAAIIAILASFPASNETRKFLNGLTTLMVLCVFIIESMVLNTAVAAHDIMNTILCLAIPFAAVALFTLLRIWLGGTEENTHGNPVVFSTTHATAGRYEVQETSDAVPQAARTH